VDDVAGMSVFLDAGHNGANDASIARQVHDGRGRTKECQTTGAQTADGYPEHSFNWDVALRIRTAWTNWVFARRCLAITTRGWVRALISAPAMANAMRPTRWSTFTPTETSRGVGGFM
jgi:N-acetylmuramoyl-L-alanine amidase